MTPCLPPCSSTCLPPLTRRSVFPFQEYIDAHPETIVLDPLPAIRTLLDRSKSYELVRKIEAYMKGVDTGGRPTAGVTRRSLGGARKGLVSLSVLGQEAVESRVGGWGWHTFWGRGGFSLPLWLAEPGCKSPGRSLGQWLQPLQDAFVLFP